MKEINLINSQRNKLFGFYQKVKIIKIIMMGFDLFLILAMGLIFLFYSISAKKLATNKTKISLIEEEINKLNENESFLVATNERIINIESITKSTSPKADLFSLLKLFLVPGFSLTSLDISSGKSSSLVGTCLDTQCLFNLNSKAEELKEKNFFSEFSIDNASRKDTDPYDLKISLKQ
jgi:hypothetical protein